MKKFKIKLFYNFWNIKDLEKTANGIKKAVLNGANPILNNEIQKEFDPLTKKVASSPERPQQKSKFKQIIKFIF